MRFGCISGFLSLRLVEEMLIEAASSPLMRRSGAGR